MAGTALLGIGVAVQAASRCHGSGQAAHEQPLLESARIAWGQGLHVINVSGGRT